MQYRNDRFKLQNLDLHFPHFTEKDRAEKRS